MDEKKVVAIISGGLDSSVMLWFLENNGYQITEAITFDYGQRHKKEIFNAKKIIEKFSESFYAVNLNIIDISDIGHLIAKGSITGNENMPQDQMYNNENQRITVVPNRNMIFLSIAAGRAIALDSSYIAYAAHSSDYAVYPDCRPEFIQQLNEAMRLGNLWTPVEIIAPFTNETKSDIVKFGIHYEVPMEYTWSCYMGSERPCLRCGTDLERTEAFLNNKIADPALTKDEWEKAVLYYNKTVETK